MASNTLCHVPLSALSADSRIYHLKFKNKGKPSSDRKKGKRKKEDGSFGSIAPITDYFEKKILMKHSSIEGESNPK